MLRSNFRRQVWRPSLVRAGLLGQVTESGPFKFRATWPDRDGVEWSMEFTTEREAVDCVATKATGGLRFHDLRHCYATWLVSGGVPVNVVRAVMGHEQASTTVNRYTHTPAISTSRCAGSSAGLLTIPLTAEEDPQSGGKPMKDEDSPSPGRMVWWSPGDSNP
ncbi:tyrosine-type recombinase/integrase [Micromonospora sp. 4G55]|nr:tyrosine-type recombinase/integrase [Micromonospora sp. 4G55]